jgi:hypothetical protein
MVPVRAGPFVDDTLKLTAPSPLPLPPLAIVIQDAPLDAVHVQPEAARTDTLPVPPPLASECDCGLTE